MQQIEELTQKQLDILFIEIQKLIKQAIDKQLSSPEVLPQVVQKELDQQIKEKWHDFKDGVDYLSQTLSRAEQFKLMQFAETEFKKRRTEYNQNINAKLYKIKPYSLRSGFKRQIV